MHTTHRRVIGTLALTTTLVVATGAMVGAQSPSAPAGTTEVAYLSASSANTWLNTSKAAMDEMAAANGITLTEYDAQFNPDTADHPAAGRDRVRQVPGPRSSPRSTASDCCPTCKRRRPTA